MTTAVPLVLDESFDANVEHAFDSVTAGEVFSVDVEKRVIRGLAMPYGVVGLKAGRRFQFDKGSVTWADPKRVKLYVRHDDGQAVGVAFELTDTDRGVEGAFRVARGAEGDRALSMAEDGVWDGLSIGGHEGARFELRDGVHHAVTYPLREVSLTPQPVFADARLSSVAMSHDNHGGTAMLCSKCGKVHAVGVTECTAADLVSFAAAQQTDTPDFSSLGTAIGDAITRGFEGLQNPQGGGPEVISGAAGGQAQVREELPYRFDGTGGEHGFLEDIKMAYSSGDNDARQRLDTFFDEAFAVTTTNIASLAPTQNRPELYVPNLSFTTPLYDLVSKGTIEDKTPFTVPRFSSSSDLVGDHAEGVEPTPGAFSATNQTVSPAPMSGKIEINREVWDQGGSPQADGIIWGEMLNAWFEAREAKIAARLATTATSELNLAGAVDGPLQTALTNYLAGLQFVRGGNRFTALASDSKLFSAVIAAKDSAGRPLFPALGPSNANGQVSGGFDRANIGNQAVVAAWALAQGANTRSYNFVPSSVWCWASAPKRFTFEYQVKSIDMAIWGYVGTAILRDSDVKPIDYDTSDI